MLYKSVYEKVSQIINFLEKNKIDCPQDIKSFLEILNVSIASGINLSSIDKQLLERYLFPDAGMGWLEDIRYQLSDHQNNELEILLKELHDLW